MNDLLTNNKLVLCYFLLNENKYLKYKIYYLDANLLEFNNRLTYILPKNILKA